MKTPNESLVVFRRIFSLSHAIQEALKEIREKTRSMKRFLRMKCKACGHWYRIEVNKQFIEQETSESKVKVLIPYYEPLKVETCKKCKSVIAEPKELIRIMKIDENKLLS
jgi:RNase P subunit RPR2